MVVHVNRHHVPAMCNVAGHGDDCFFVGFGLDDCVPLFVGLVLYLYAVPAQKPDHYVGSDRFFILPAAFQFAAFLI